MIRLKKLLTEDKIQWKTPDISGAKESIEELSDELFIDSDKVIGNFHNGKVVYLPKHKIDSIQNFNLNGIESYLSAVDYIQNRQKSNPEYVRDWVSIRDALKKQEPVEAPVVMKYKKDFYLLDGKIRLMMAKILNIPIRVYLFYYQA